jgi:Arm DNA-binding domain
VSATGSKSWVFRFKRDGKAHDMGLGSFPSVSLAEARQKATEARQQRDAGKKDPIAERDAAAARNGSQTHARQPSRNAPSS